MHDFPSQPDSFDADGLPLPGPETKAGFKPRLGTRVLLVFLIIIWPGIGLTLLLFGETSLDLDRLDPVLFIFLPTIILQWLIFLAVALGVFREQSSFSSIGLVRPRPVDLPRAVAFLLVSNVILTGLQWLLSLVGLTVSAEVGDLVRKAGSSIGWWLALSITAGVCEEAAFRGYIMTRIKGLFPGTGWALPVLLSSLSFAAGHSYQGVAGLILLFVYGLMFCGLFLYTKSLWPGILAHFIQDFSAIFIFQYMDF